MPSALRIALLVDPITVLVKGARHPVELARELEARGHVVRIFGAPKGLLGTTEGEEDPSTPRFGGATVLSFEPDAVLAYDALSPVAWLGSRIARRRGIPLVLVEDGKLSAGSAWRRATCRVGETLWGRYVRHTAGSVVALDPVAHEHAVREGFEQGTLRTLPHGVDPERYRPGLSSPLIFRHRIGGRILLHAGSHDGYADLEMLITAFARTVGQRGDWSLVLAGRRNAAPWLRAIAHRLGVAARVHFLKVTEADLPALYSSSTLVAQPARDDRTSGISVIRAMSSGRPVLASDLPRLRFAVEDGENGLLAPAGDLASWTRMLQRAASSPEARKRWGRRGREIASERFQWKRLAGDWEATIGEARKRLGAESLEGTQHGAARV